MSDPKLHVKCTVANCDYNESLECHADALEVYAMGDGKAKTSDGTGCKTFKDTK